MYDVLLLSIEQPNEIDEKLSYGNLTIETMNHFGDIREKYYFEKWPFLNNLNGILYRIYTEDQFGEFQCGDGYFNSNMKVRLWKHFFHTGIISGKIVKILKMI